MSDDLISRQEALDAIGKVADELYENIKKGATFPQRQWFDGMAHAQSILEDLPSAQPERKKGEWIRNDNGTYSCSVCQSWIPEEQHYYARYCLYCGADMRGEDDGKQT